MNVRKVVFMIDGWFMWHRVRALKAFSYNGAEIRNYCIKHLRKGDQLYRIFYYDTNPLTMKAHNPISKNLIDFSTTSVAKAQTRLLESIKTTPNFALRLGETVWRNQDWLLKPEIFNELLNKKKTFEDITAEDLKPRIEQKAVDMKIGIDISLIAMKKLADLLIIITGDSDMVPALKLARREGMQVLLDPMRKHIRPELGEHVDYIHTKIPPLEKKLSNEKGAENSMP